MQPGQVNGGGALINLLDSAKGLDLPFAVKIVGASDWVSVTQDRSVTPATLTVTFDADQVQPGEYSGSLVVDVDLAGVQNDPLVIELALTVESVIRASPSSADFVYFPCEEPLAARTRSVELSAQNSLSYSYTAQIEDNPTWVTVAPESGVLPEEVSVSVNPALRPADIATADLLITVDLPGVPGGVINRVPIFLVCPAYRLYTPSVLN